MRFLRSCTWFYAMLLAAVPAVSAVQVDQPAGASKTAEKAEKKVRQKAKKGEQTGEAAAESAAASAKHGATTSEQAAERPKNSRARTEATGSAHRAMPTVPESEIAAAKASGKVWVNTESGVYHKGGQWYGATKQGKFMTEREAIQSGYRASKSK